MERFDSRLRIPGRAIVIVGLAIFYGSFLVTLAGRLTAPATLWMVGLIIAAAGCLWLLGALLWTHGHKGRVTFEVVLGFLCLPPGFLAFFLTLGDELGLQLSWLIITIFLLPGAIALITQAARVKRTAEGWRNTVQKD